MLYFKKESSLYYRFDPVTFSYMEAYSSANQARAMSITNEELYNQTMQRVQDHSFESATAEEFTAFLNVILTRLGS